MMAVFIVVYIAEQAKVRILRRETSRLSYALASMYFLISFVSTCYWYVLEYQYEEEILAVASQLSGKNEVLVITKQPPEKWNYLTGLHLLNYSLSDDENKWQNVAFARFHDLKGVRLIK